MTILLKKRKNRVGNTIIGSAIFGFSIGILNFMRDDIMQTWKVVSAFLLKTTLVKNWMIGTFALIVLSLMAFILWKLFSPKKQSQISELEQKILLLMVERGDEGYQLPFFVKLLETDESKIKLYLRHLEDLDFVSYNMNDALKHHFPHYFMNPKGREYLIANKLV